MAVSSARQVAFDILLRVERDRAWASELLNALRMEKLSREDRALCHELVMTTLRWQAAVDARIAKYSSQQISRLDAEVRTALRLAACQLFYLDRIPAHAAVHESVELVKATGKRSAAPFANAVLRKISAEAKSAASPQLHGEDEVQATTPLNEKNVEWGTRDMAEERVEWGTRELAAEFAHPEWVVARWIDMYGFTAARAICAANQQPPGIAIRLSPGPTAPLKQKKLPPNDEFAGDPGLEWGAALEQVQDELSAAGIRLAPGKILASARRVVSGHLAQCAAFREHRIAVQDEASQLVAALVGRGARILDCCAAPGGKTAAIAARNLTPARQQQARRGPQPGSEIVALELHEHRARTMKERLRGLPVKVVCADVRTMEWTEPFDRVLADVPCSGTGTLAANPEIKWRLQPSDFARLKDLQVSILSAAADALAPGGRLVYSTCSLEREECEQVVEQLLSGLSGLQLVDCSSVLEELKDSGELVWNDLESLVRGPFLRTLPGIHPCGGFFAAVLCRSCQG